MCQKVAAVPHTQACELINIGDKKPSRYAITRHYLLHFNRIKNYYINILIKLLQTYQSKIEPLKIMIF